MRQGPIFSPRFKRTLAKRFPLKATVERNTPTRTASGDQVYVWAAVDGMVDVPAVRANSRSEGVESRGQDQTTYTDLYDVLLAGVWTDITPKDRLNMSDGVKVEIEAIDLPIGGPWTLLKCRVISGGRGTE